MNKSIAIIGAGPAGYNLAILLAKRGYEVEMFEKRADPSVEIQAGEGRSTNFIFSLRSYEGFKRAGVL